MSGVRDKEYLSGQGTPFESDPEARSLGKCRAVVAGQDREESDERRDERGERGRAQYPSAGSERTEPEPGKDDESRKRDEVAGGAQSGPGHRSKERDPVHDAGNSFALTLAPLSPLAVCVCVFGPRTADWTHVAVAAGYCGVLFAFSIWAARRWSGEETAFARTACMESRLAVVPIGVAAVGFGSPALLEIAPDVLAVAIAGSGLADGSAVGSLARKRGCSSGRALRVLIRHGEREPAS